MEVIVVGSDHYNTLCVIRTLGLVNIKPYVIIYNSNKSKSYVLKSKYIGKSIIINDFDSIYKYIIDYSTKSNTTPFLFTTDDVLAENIDKEYNRLKEYIIAPNCENEQGRLGYWMEKWNMNEIAKEAGFNIPWTISIDLTKETVQELPVNYFPCILKPLKSIYGTKYDVRICHDNKEYNDALRQMKGKCDHYIVQEFIKPDFELTIDGLRSRKADYTLFPGVIIKDRTCTSTHNLGMVALAHLEKNIEQYIDAKVLTKFLKRIDYNGLCSFDLFVKNGKTYFLESNLRTDGDMFIYTTAGINFPMLWMSLESGNKTNSLVSCNKSVYGMIEISYIKYINWKKPISIIKDWWKTDCYSIFSWKDIKPFFYKFIYAIW